jgi:RNA polymerase sigma-70 factor (ECF subfamily)
MRIRKGYKSVKYLTHDEDKALVLEAISGNQKAYNTLAQKYKPILYTAAKRRLGQAEEEDLEDIVMAVMGACFVKIKQYDPEKSKFFTWMIACLHNYVNGIPKKKKQVTTQSYGVGADSSRFFEIDSEDMLQNIDREQVVKLVRLLVANLPEDISRAISLKYFKGYTHEEIAQEIGCETNVVWYKLKRGKEMLKKLSEQNNLF